MPETITTNDADYAYAIVEKICNEVGPGLPGSPQERERANIIRQELESHLGENNVSIEEFMFAPGAFLGSVPISATLMVVAAFLNISTIHFVGIPILVILIPALVISILSELSIIFEFINYSEFLDPLFRKKRSVNVIGSLRKPGARNIKRLLIISGHHDSALENIWFRLFGYGFFFPSLTLFAGINTVLVMILIQLVGLVINNNTIVNFGTIGWGLMAFPVLPAFIFGIFFTRGRKNGGVVPGAADNLSASALSVAMCRFLVRNPSYIPEDTEIRFISFGGEEAGLRGSRSYVNSHIMDLRMLDARILNFETVAHPEIAILTSDINNRVKNNPDMVKSVIEAASRAKVPFKVKPYPFGASDAASFSQAGLKATTLLPFKMPRQLVSFYPQKWDRPEVLTIEPLLNVLKLTFEWIRNEGKDSM